MFQIPFAYSMRTRSHKEHEDVHSVQGRSLSVKYEQIQSVWKNCLLMVCTEEESRVSVSLIPGHVQEFVTEYFINVVFGQINNGFATPSRALVVTNDVRDSGSE